MTPNLLSHDQIIQEVFPGTGAPFAVEAARRESGENALHRERANVLAPKAATRSDAFDLKAFLLFFGLCSAAGAPRSFRLWRCLSLAEVSISSIFCASACNRSTPALPPCRRYGKMSRRSP